MSPFDKLPIAIDIQSQKIEKVNIVVVEVVIVPSIINILNSVLAENIARITLKIKTHIAIISVIRYAKLDIHHCQKLKTSYGAPFNLSCPFM